MDTTGNLASGEQPGDGLAITAEDAGLGVDLETTHGVVEDRGHESNVEDIVHLPFAGLEELFAEWTLLGLDDIVVVLERLFELSGADANVPCESSSTLIALHETTANIVLAVPLDLFGSFTVENEADRMLDTERSAGAGGNDIT